MALAALLSTLGCKASPASESEGTRVAPSEAPAGASESSAGTTAGDSEPTLPAPPMGRVRGVVTLAEGGELPRYTHAQLGFDDERTPLPDACSRPSDADLEPVKLTDARALVGLGVAATGTAEIFRRVPRPEGRRHAVAIRDCRLTPRFVAAVIGDTLAVTNEVSYGYLLGYTTLVAQEGVGHRQTHEVEITRPGVQALACEWRPAAVARTSWCSVTRSRRRPAPRGASSSRSPRTTTSCFTRGIRSSAGARGSAASEWRRARRPR